VEPAAHRYLPCLDPQPRELGHGAGQERVDDEAAAEIMTGLIACI